MIRQISKLIAFSILAFAGGALASQIWPDIAANFGYKFQPPAPVVRVEKTQITIQENKALKDAVAKVSNTVLGIKSTNSKGVSTQGSGLILTSDGLAVALSSFLPPNSTMEIVAGGKKTAFQVLKRDKENNLALLKLEGSNWPTASFYQMDDLKLGERILLVGITSGGGNFVNEGTVREFNAGLVLTNITEKAEANGSPVFDIEGNIMGIASLDKTGRTSIIPISKIKTFSDL